MRRIWAVLWAFALTGCAGGPHIDTRYRSVSQDSRVQFLILHFTGGSFPAQVWKGFMQVASVNQPVHEVTGEEAEGTQAGYAVYEAADVDGALNALDEEQVDAVVLDVRLPDPMGWGRTGLEVLAFIRLHTLFSQLPVLHRLMQLSTVA